MLNEFRTLSNSLFAKILLSLLVLSFVIWGVGDMVTRAARNGNVAKVGSEGITTEEFRQAVRAASENMRNQLGDQFSPELLQSLHVPEQVIHKIVNQSLVTQESRALGLTPGNAEVVDYLRKIPAFQGSDGKFDRKAFEYFLKARRVPEKYYIEQLREEMGRTMLMSVLLETVPVSDTAAATLYRIHEEPRSVSLYTLGNAQLGTAPTPDDAAVDAYYQANSSAFATPEYRTVSYVVLDYKQLPVNAQVSESELKAAYEERRDEFRRPDRRTVEQLLYNSEEDAKKASAALASGKSFAQVAKDIPPTNSTLSMGKIERSAVPDAAADAVFSGKAGGVTAPVQDDFGWHIFHVVSIEPSAVSFDEVRGQLEKDLKQRKVDDAQNAIANKLEDTLAGGAGLQNAAQSVGLKSVDAGTFDGEGKSPSGQKVALPALDKFLETAFKTDEKSESPLINAGGGKYYILRVENVKAASVRPLSEVRQQVVAGWQQQERAKQLAALAKTVSADFVDPAKRAGVIETYHLQPTATLTLKQSSTDNKGLPADMLATIFTLKEGGATQAYLGKDGQYVMAVVDRITPVAAPTGKNAVLDKLKKDMEADAQNEIMDQYMGYLYDKYSVSINQSAMRAAIQ